MKPLHGIAVVSFVAILSGVLVVNAEMPEIQEIKIAPYDLSEKAYTLDARGNNVVILEKKIENTFSEMSERERVGQLFMPAVGSNGSSYGSVKALAERGEISGFMVLGKNISDAQIQELRNIFIERDDIPPLVALDAEPSLISSRVTGARANSTATYNTEESSKTIGERISGLMRSKGYNVNFAPVYDTNANNSVIGSRSYGPTTDITSRLANAFKEGSNTFNIATTAKHFPGHGQVVGDSHKLLPTINGSLSELPAFVSAIEAKVPLIMIGHLNIDTPELNTTGRPATLSPLVMNDLLRDELKYDGVIITDAFNMNALDGFSDKEIVSIEAGADIVLMPEGSISDHISDIVEKMNEDKEYKADVEQKVKRVLELRHTLQ